MSLSKKEKKILNNAISDYQTAVREREAEEWARQEAERREKEKREAEEKARLEAERRKEEAKRTTKGCFLLIVIVVVIFIILYLLGLREWIINIITFFILLGLLIWFLSTPVGEVVGPLLLILFLLGLLGVVLEFLGCA